MSEERETGRAEKRETGGGKEGDEENLGEWETEEGARREVGRLGKWETMWLITTRYSLLATFPPLPAIGYMLLSADPLATDS